MDIEFEKKQNYLRSEILDKNYNPDTFIQYITQIKGEDATDLEIWTFDELEKAVKEFIVKHGSIEPNDEASNSHYDSDGEAEPASQTVKPKGTNKEIQEDNIIPSIKIENFEEIIACEKTEETEISQHPNIKITISFPEKHGGGFFSKAYITYLVSCQPLDYKVRRRYSDFEWLRSTLLAAYPNLAVPPIPKKNYGDRFNEIFVSKRMRFLEKFLDALASHPVIKRSRIFQEFLSLENETNFNNYKKDLLKLKTPVKISEMKSIDGFQKSKITKDSDKYSDTIKTYVNINEMIFKKLGSSFKNLFIEMNQVSIRMKEISELYGQLHVISEKTKDNETVIDTYKMLSKLMNDWGDAERKQSILIDVELKEYFKYLKHEFISFKDTINKMEINKSAYYKAESRLNLTKENLFRQGNIARWEITPEEIKNCDKNELLKNRDYAFSKMLQKESFHVNQLKINYGFYSNQQIDEFDRIRELNGVRHKKHVISLSSNHSDILADLHVMWADLLSYYSDVYDSNSKNYY